MFRNREDLSNPEPTKGATRRDVLVGAGTVGFALAVQPVSAKTIETDSVGLVAGMVTIPVGDGTIPAYQAAPATGTSLPVIVLVQEVFGLHEHILDVARRLAKQGYLVIAPDLYSRQGDPRTIADIPQILTQIVSKVPDDQVFSDIDASIAYVKAQGRGDVSRLGITGFCWGGRVVWLYSARNPAVRAGVAWYGVLAAPRWNAAGATAIDAAAKLSVPVLGLYAGQDAGIPLSDVIKMREALAGKSSEIAVYPDAGHGFNADYRPSYNEAAALDAWRKMLDWFKAHGVA